MGCYAPGVKVFPANSPGWVFRDTPVYDAAAERRWQTPLALLDAKLKLEY